MITKIEDKPNIFPVPDLSHDVSRDVHVREKKKNLQEEEQETNFRGGRCRILGERGVGDCSRNRK